MSGKQSNHRSGETTGSVRGNPLDSDFALEASVDWVGESESLPELPQDRYLIVEELQHGGMGIIFRAIDRYLCREVAVKLLRRDRADCEASLREFEAEAHIMSFLSHPGVTPIYDRGHSIDGRPFHVMKLIDGATLTELMNQRRVPLARLLSVFAKTCEIVAFAHSRDIVHLDLKPSNVMVGAFGEVNVMDWGLARYCEALHESARNDDSIGEDVDKVDTAKSPVRGTPAYMSPEQAHGKQLDQRTDVFGLGCILCEILTGSPPYNSDAPTKVFRDAASARLTNAYRRLDSTGVDDSLICLAKQCLQSNPDRRPANAWIVAKVVLDYQESALTQVRSDMDRFFELSPDLFCIADFQGYFRRVNENFSRVLGYREHQILAKPFLEFVHPDDHKKTLAIMNDLDAGNSVVRFQNRYRTASGDYIVLEWTAKTIDEEDVIFAVAREIF
jgi:serine/threonine-protein kinase